jgi:hypothetical protein
MVMKKIIGNQRKITFFLLLTLLSAAYTQDAPSFLRVESKTFDKEKFVFPDNFAAPELNIVFLGMNADREDGEYQQKVLLDWHAALAAQGAFDANTLAYHFQALESPPFFVKGIIRNAIAESYEDKVPMSQAGVLYVKDLEVFAASAGLQPDGQATIVLVTPDGALHEVFKGEPTPEGLAALRAAQSAYLSNPAQQE